MKNVVRAGAIVAAALCATSTAIAGVADVITTAVEELSDVVTYSTGGTKPLTTRVGYKVTVSNVGGNTVNSVVFRGDAKVLKLADNTENELEKPYYVEVNDDAGACGIPSGTSTAVTCNLGQMRAGSVRTFAVFFKSPIRNNTCYVLGGPNCEAVRFSGVTDYSEGTNDGSAVNDRSVWTGPADVSLGTASPTKVKTALAKSGGVFFTGSDGVPSTLTYPFATRLTAPNPPVFGSATISLKKFLLSSNSAIDVAEAQWCTNAGNFVNCYEAGIQVPGVTYTYVAGGTNYLTTILRIDSSEVISPFRASRVKVYYTESETDPSVNELPYCPPDGVPLPSAPHCVVNNIFRYSNAGPNGELRGDVQIEVHGLRNGFLRTR